MLLEKVRKFLSYSLILYQVAGFEVFIREIARRIYSKSYFVRLGAAPVFLDTNLR
jgi:hypothetical protein